MFTKRMINSLSPIRYWMVLEHTSSTVSVGISEIWLVYSQKTGDTVWTVEYMRERNITSARMLKGKIKRLGARLMGLNPTYCRCVGQVKLTKTENGNSTEHCAAALWEQMGFGAGKTAKLGKIL